MLSDDRSNMHEQNVKALLRCKSDIDLTYTKFYENIKSNIVLLKKVLGTDESHGFVDKRNSVLFVVFSTIRRL